MLRALQNNIKTVKFQIVRLIRVLVEVRNGCCCCCCCHLLLLLRALDDAQPDCRAPLLSSGCQLTMLRCVGVRYPGAGPRRGEICCMNFQSHESSFSALTTLAMSAIQRFVYMKLDYYDSCPAEYEPPGFRPMDNANAVHFSRKPFYMCDKLCGCSYIMRAHAKAVSSCICHGTSLACFSMHAPQTSHTITCAHSPQMTPVTSRHKR